MKIAIRLFFTVLVISGLAYGLHVLLVDDPAIALWKIYTFFSIATLVTVACLKWIQLYMPDKLGVAFLALVSIKFGLIFFIFPELFDEQAALSTRDLLGFLAPYFLYLAIEIGMVLKWLNDN